VQRQNNDEKTVEEAERGLWLPIVDLVNGN